MTYRAKMIIAILAILLLAATISTLVGRTVATEALEDQATEHLSALAESKSRTVENLVNYQLESVELVATQISAYYAMLQRGGSATLDVESTGHQAMGFLLQSMVSSNDYVWQAFYVNKDGTVVASAYAPDTSDTSHSSNQGTLVFDDWNQVDYDTLDWAAVDTAKLDWSKVNYSQIDWNNLDLTRVDWSQVNWEKVDFANIDFATLDMTQIDWSTLEIAKVDWSNVDLKNLNWSSIDLHAVNWEENDLSSSHLFLEGKKGPYICNRHMYEGSTEFVVAASAPFFSGDEFAGVMVYFGGEKELAEIMTESSGLGKTGEVYLLDGDGLMLTPSQFVEDSVLQQKVSLADISLTSEDYDTVTRDNYLGDEVFGVYHPVAKTPWTIVVEKSRSEVLEPVSDLTWTMIWSMLGLLGVLMVVGIVLANKMSQPIVRLRQGAERIMQGDWNAEVATKSKDEVGDLSRTFDAMTERLQQSQEELQQYSIGLEEKVRERTAELSQANHELERAREGLEEKVRERTHQLAERLTEREILLKEIHHRVKNNLQIISSLLNLQKYSIADKMSRSLFEESGRRVQSMALIHEQLYQSGDLAVIDFKQYLHDLTDNLVRTYATDSKGIVVNIDADDISLAIDTAVPCGLMVNELITNSLKYAFPESWQEGHFGDDTPAINIGLAMSDDQILTLVVADNGIGLPKELEIDRTETLGMQLVTSLTSQLHASVEVERIEGTTFRIRIPQSDPSA